MVGMAAAAMQASRRSPPLRPMAQSSQLRYSRTREQEADRVGLNTLAQAEHRSQRHVAYVRRMKRAYRFTSSPPEFLLTHPLSETRIADAKLQAQAYGIRPTSIRRTPDYTLMRESGPSSTTGFAPDAR